MSGIQDDSLNAACTNGSKLINVVASFQDQEQGPTSSGTEELDPSTESKVTTNGHQLASASDTNMIIEIEAAVKFLTEVLKSTSKFSPPVVETFRHTLIDLLRQHYEGHWYPNDPFKGSGYRCLRVNGVMNPLLTKAAKISGLPLTRFRNAFPVELTVWVDPGDVSIRFGEDGSIGVYYAKNDGGLLHDHREMEGLQKLTKQVPRRAVTPPANIVSANLSKSAEMLLDPLPSKPGQHHQSKFSRFSPPTVQSTSMVGSPPASYIFSPYDGKSVPIHSNDLPYSNPGDVGVRTTTSSISAIVGRRSPTSSYHQQQQQARFAKAQSEFRLMVARSPPTTIVTSNTNGFRSSHQQQQSYRQFINSEHQQHHPHNFSHTSQYQGFDFTSTINNSRHLLASPVIGQPSQQQAQHMRPVNGDMTDPWPPTSHTSYSSKFPLITTSSQHQHEYQFYSNTHMGSAYCGTTVGTGQNDEDHQRGDDSHLTSSIVGRFDALGLVNC